MLIWRLKEVMKALHIGIMGQMNRCLILVSCLSLLPNPCATSSFISDAESGGQIYFDQRRILQAKKSCGVDFEHQNYTIITSQCKGPNYSPRVCCSSFLLFACPFVDELNDVSNDCSVIMFSYIKRIGNYPDGLFSSLCRDGRDGLNCPKTSATAGRNGGAGVWTAMMMIWANVVIIAISLV